MSAEVSVGIDALRAEAMAAGRRPRRFGSLYVTEHWLRAMRAYGWTLIINAVGQPVVYLLGLGLGLASLISLPITDGDQQVRYVVFVAPALLASAAIAVASEEFTFPVMAGFKWRRHFYGFNASPLSSRQIANGVVLGTVVRILIVAGAYYLIIWGFQAVPDPVTGWLAILAGLLGALGFGAPLLAYASSLTEDRGQFALVQRLIFMPMFLFSGTFYPLSNLGPLQVIGWVSPLWHAAELGRAVTYGKELDPVMWCVHLGYLLVLAAGGLWAAHRLFERRLSA